MTEYEEEDRQTYQEIRIDAFESAYGICRNEISGFNTHGYTPMSESDIFAHFFDEDYTLYDDTIDRNIDKLMHCTLDLILQRGVGTELSRKKNMRIIKDILSRNSFDELAEHMSEEEVADLGQDLRLLKFID